MTCCVRATTKVDKIKRQGAAAVQDAKGKFPHGTHRKQVRHREWTGVGEERGMRHCAGNRKMMES